ncbi:MAG: aminodeoxychorismate/anthranilate synthase component II [Methylocystaceae bacterium]|jgi:anthranilate synthase component 2|nr:aminodeoxychorismate/anthranilate synthase component II [Methylocystaceae bacterium]NBT96575.1 aminodeoxychorismate/anthranilate synthase component II [Methylocystaceae bacterium]
MSNVTLIDNYDSFTFNLVHYFGQLGANVTVHRNDSVSVSDVIQAAPDAIILSPGPCTPHEAGICMNLIRSASETIPIFGVCLGHQSIGEVFGGDVVRAPMPIHGKMATIHHTGATLFRGIEGPFQATRYHSLVVKRETLPDCLQITAHTPDDLIMALSHKTLPVHGVQFHPESITSQHGHKILRNFLDLADEWNDAHRGRTKVA